MLDRQRVWHVPSVCFVLVDLTKRSSLASFTEIAVLNRSYVRTTNISWNGQIPQIEFCKSGWGLIKYLPCQPLPLKPDTTSQPVKAWKNNIPLDFSALKTETRSWIGIHWLCFPLPNESYIFSRPIAMREGIMVMAIITMAMSLASIIRDISLPGCMPDM